MSGVRRTLSVLVAALVFSGVGVGEAAVPASAASCYGYSCHGHDPTAYGCSTSSIVGPVAFTLHSLPYAIVYNRYSTSCNANWASAQLTSYGIAAGFALQVDISTRDRLGKNEFMCYPGLSNTGNLSENCHGVYFGSLQAYSDMVDGTNLTYGEVCVFDNRLSLLGCSPLARQ
jgi:hypothetical protein